MTSFKQIYKTLIIYLIFLLVGCGGGGGSSSSPDIKLPPEVDPWALIKPSYSGMETDYEITRSNAAQISYNTLEYLDLIHMLAFGDYFKHLFFLTENLVTPLSNTAQCEQGTMLTTEVEPQTKTELKYTNCIIDGLRINGVVRLKTEINSNGGAIILDFNIEDIASGEKQIFTGYINIINSESARYNILISDSLGKQIWFDNFSLDINLLSEKYGIIFLGDMYISDKGKLSITTSNIGTSIDDYTSTITLSGTQDIVLNNTLQKNIEIRLGEQYIPVILPLTGYPSSLFDESNQPPVAIITNVSSSTDRNQALALSAINSSDPDYDFLTFVWEVIDKPIDSQTSVQPTAITSFLSDLPGLYTVRLTVKDTNDVSSVTETVIKVLKNIPAGSLDLMQLENSIGQSFQAQINLINDSYDGPFTYKLKYGPANMLVDENGTVTWDAVIPDYGKSTNVNFSIYVENEDKFNLFAQTVLLESISQPVIEKRTDSKSVPWNSNVQIKESFQDGVHFFSGIPARLQIENSKITHKHFFLIGPASDGNVTFQAVHDANDDGINDYWYSSINDIKQEYNISWMDGETGEENVFIEFDAILNGFIYFQFEDYNQNGTKDLIISNTIFGTKVISTESKEEIAIYDEPDQYIARLCDFNGDGHLDAKYQNTITDIHNNNVIYSPSSIFDTVKTTINQCKAIRRNNLGNLFLVDVGTGNEKLIFENTFSTSSVSVNTGDFDNDGIEEIIVSGRVFVTGSPSTYEAILLDNIDSASINTVPLSTENQLDLSVLSDIKLISDIDQNGIVDMIFTQEVQKELTPGEFLTMSQHISYTLDGTVIKQNYSSDPYRTSSYEINSWDNENSLSLTTDSLVAISKTALPIEYQTLFNSNSIDIAVENDVTYIYRTIHPNTDVIKQDLLGNEIWRTDTQQDTSSSIEGLTVLKNGLLLVKSHSFNHLLHPDTGEILHIAPLRLSTAGPQFSLFESDTVDYFADLRTFSFLEIGKNFDINELPNPFIGDQESASFHYSFIQFDNDLQPELLNYSAFNQTYQVIDMVNFNFEPSSDLHDGEVPFNENISDINHQCFNWEKDCRNFITYSDDRYSYQVVDKLTGIVIWKSPNFSSIIADLKFNRVDSVISTALSYHSGFVYTITN